MSLGGGAVYGSSTKQKLNTRISTEAELVGVNDALPQVLWTRKFSNGLGYGDTDSVIYQDNQSAMLLETNTPCRCALLFCEGSNCIQGDQSGILSNWHNDGRELHKIIARSIFHRIL